MSHKGKLGMTTKGRCHNLSTLVGLQNDQVELGWKVFILGNHSADE
jgi:hypothetical protein